MQNVEEQKQGLLASVGENHIHFVPISDMNKPLHHSSYGSTVNTSHVDSNGAKGGGISSSSPDVLLEVVSEDWESGPDDCAEVHQPHDRVMPLMSIIAILSTAFSYGCILTTLFLITLPIECERIHVSDGRIPKSVVLGIFVAMAGITQLVSPLIGRASDTFEPPTINGSGQRAELGQRLPFYMLGAALSVMGLFCQMLTSYAALWIRYGFSFFFSMVGLNIQYAIMLALIPDQIPRSQTGVANGILAQLLVTGSIFGFALFHLFITHDDIGSMYGLYASIVILSSIMTGSYAHERDVSLTLQRIQAQRQWTKDHPSAQGVESTTPSATVEPSPKHWPTKARRATKRAMKRAVQKARQIVLTPTLIGQSLVEPFRHFTWSIVFHCYLIDVSKHRDFAIVTLSRLFYYCGMSVQTFFLYFLHDVIHVKTNPEAAVAILAIIGQCSAALTCYPVGAISDHLLDGRRTPFVHVACFILAGATLSLVFATSFQHMIIICLVLGASNGVYLTAETSLAVDTLSSEAVLDTDSGSAQLLGIWGVAAFLGSALGPMIGGPLLCWFGAPSVSMIAFDDETGTKLSASDALKLSTMEEEIDAEEYSLLGYTVLVSLSAFYFICSSLTLRLLRNQHE